MAPFVQQTNASQLPQPDSWQSYADGLLNHTTGRLICDIREFTSQILIFGITMSHKNGT
jgi:hypothetical protein